MRRLTKIALLMSAAWLSLTSMSTLNACSNRVNNSTAATTVVTGQNQPSAVTTGDVVMGAARTSEYVPMLKGKRVALLSNQTGKHLLLRMLQQ